MNKRETEGEGGRDDRDTEKIGAGGAVVIF